MGHPFPEIGKEIRVSRRANYPFNLFLFLIRFKLFFILFYLLRNY